MEEQSCRELTSEDSGVIRAIDKTSVHQICSGQVILTLATAVKELIENSLDAGATNIEVKLKEYGSESIEVIDNGSGVEEKNYEALTLKHYTSKLTRFSDLVGVETFGFRGEALSSLCALSKVTITTSCTFDGIGTRLEFDHGGKLVSKKPCARQHGTSVLVEQLFTMLPVRHKEFQRNIKKEFTKMTQIVSAYCIINTGVRLTCSNHTGNGKKLTVLSVMGNSSVKENIADIFGIKQLQGLVEISCSPPDESILAEFELQPINEETPNLFSIRGFISSCEHGSGRSSADRQFYFINKRPFDPAKMSRLVNEVYHLYNRHQYPMVVLDLTFAKDLVDVNVTPDKRQIFVQNEKMLLATLKSSLMKMFQSQVPLISTLGSSANVTLNSAGPLRLNKGDAKDNKTEGSSNKSEESSLSSALVNLKRSFQSAFNKSSVSKTPSTDGRDQPKQMKISSVLTRIGESVTQAECIAKETDSMNSELPIDYDNAKKNEPQKAVPNQFISEVSKNACIDDELSEELSSFDILDNSEKSNEINECQESSDQLHLSEPSDSEVSDDIPRSLTSGKEAFSKHYNDSYFEKCEGVDILESEKAPSVKQSDAEDVIKETGVDEGFISQDVAEETKLQNRLRKSSRKCRIEASIRKTTATDTAGSFEKKTVTLSFSMEQLKKKLKSQQESQSLQTPQYERHFRAAISPSNNEVAENELKKELRKDMFEKMQILGQFNLGFIISRLNQDLFIIDQHATDEKYNFEQLEQNTVLVGQRLIQPQKLQLTVVNESILSENLDIFHKNGFEFTVDETAPPGNRILLQSIPTSKNWLFGKDDIDEMIFMLSETPGVMCRPSRIRQMLASRACRSSVMIGTALSKPEMKKLVAHMGEIEQPWNCPHGRPTIRHLINLDMISDV